jgi:hypothetical protein
LTLTFFFLLFLLLPSPSFSFLPSLLHPFFTKSHHFFFSTPLSFFLFSSCSSPQPFQPSTFNPTFVIFLHPLCFLDSFNALCFCPISPPISPDKAPIRAYRGLSESLSEGLSGMRGLGWTW